MRGFLRIISFARSSNVQPGAGACGGINGAGSRAGRAGDRAIIDLMLAHVPANRVEGAYNRAAYMERRREIAQEWADLLLEGLEPADHLLRLPRR